MTINYPVYRKIMSNVNKRWNIFGDAAEDATPGATLPPLTIADINKLIQPVMKNICVVKIITLVTFLITWFLLYFSLSEKW